MMANLFPKRFLRDIATELRIFSNHVQHVINPKQRRRLKQLSQQGNLRLNMGCGPLVFDGWVNIDAFPGGDIVCDLRRGLPFPNNSVDFIFHEHFLEHLDFYLEVPQFLEECRRVLQPSGVMRIIVPDAEKFAKAYLANRLDWFHHVEPQRKFSTCGEGLAFNFQYTGQHRSGWDYETLAAVLQKLGFGEVQKTEYGASPVPELNLESDSSVRAAHSLCVNVRK